MYVDPGFFVWELELMDRADAEALLRWAALRVVCIWLSFGTHTLEWVHIVKDVPQARAGRPRELIQPRRLPDLLIVRVVTWADTSVGAVRCVAAPEEVVQQVRAEVTEVLCRLREGVEGVTGLRMTDGKKFCSCARCTYKKHKVSANAGCCPTCVILRSLRFVGPPLHPVDARAPLRPGPYLVSAAGRSYTTPLLTRLSFPGALH
jgi:hypothetical protein